jgi:hypothetical protein
MFDEGFPNTRLEAAHPRRRPRGPTSGPVFGVAASGRLRTSLDVERSEKACFFRPFALSTQRRWMLVEVFGGGKWWAVGGSDCSASSRAHKTQIVLDACISRSVASVEIIGVMGRVGQDVLRDVAPFCGQLSIGVWLGFPIHINSVSGKPGTVQGASGRFRLFRRSDTCQHLLRASRPR